MLTDVLVPVLAALAATIPPSLAYAFSHHVRLEAKRLELKQEDARKMNEEQTNFMLQTSMDVAALTERIAALEALTKEQQTSLNTIAERY